MKKPLLRKIVKALVIVLIVILALPLVPALLLCIPPVQDAAVGKARDILKQSTGIDASVGAVHLKLPLAISIDDVLALDVAQDTILSVKNIILKSDLEALRDSTVKIGEFRLVGVVFDSHDLMGATSLKARLGNAYLKADSTSIAGHYTLLNSLNIKDADVELITGDSQDDEETGTPFDWRFDVSTLGLENIRFAMPAAEFEVGVGGAHLEASGDIAGQNYRIDSLTISQGRVFVGGLPLEIDEVDVKGEMRGKFIDVPHLKASAGSLNLEARASMNLDSLAQSIEYEADIALNKFRLQDIIAFDKECAADGKIHIEGRGFDPSDKDAKISLDAKLGSALWDNISAGQTRLTAGLAGCAAKGSISTEAAMSAGSTNIAAEGLINFDIRNLDSKKPSLAAGITLPQLIYDSDSLKLNIKDIDINAATGAGKTSLELQTDGLKIAAEGGGYAPDLAKSFEKLIDALPKTIELPDVKDIIAARPISLPDLGLERLKGKFPSVTLNLNVGEANPLSEILAANGLRFSDIDLKAALSPEEGVRVEVGIDNLRKDTLSLESARISVGQDGDNLKLAAAARMPSQAGLPEVKAGVEGILGSKADSRLALKASTEIRDGVMSIEGISTAIDLDVDLALKGGLLSADGAVELGDLVYDGHNFADRKVNFSARPAADAEGYSLEARTDEIPLPLLESFIGSQDINLEGTVAAAAFAEGPLDNLKIRGEAITDGVAIGYSPFNARFALEGGHIGLEDMNLTIKDLSIIAQDSTKATLGGGIALSPVALDLRLRSDRFKPAPFAQDDSTAYYGNIAASLDLAVRGPADSLWIGGDIGILPETEVTYLLGKKNYIHAGVDGRLQLDFPLGGELALNGRVGVQEGKVHYTLPFYPIAPFTIDNGSHIDFEGPLSAMKVDLTASQKARAMVSEVGQRVRTVDFNVGLQIGGALDNLSLHFLLDAPRDEIVRADIAQMSVEDRDRVAAALLTTGMYTSEANAEAGSSGYALASMIQRGLNTVADNRLGKIVDIDFGMSGSSGYESATTDYKMNVSKSFFDDRLKLTVGGAVSTSDDGSSSSTSAFLDNVSAEYFMGETRGTSIKAFHKHDYENIMDGDITKEGIGVQTYIAWKDKKGSKYPYMLDLEGDVSYRSNQQIGPSLAATLSKYNLLGLHETLSARLQGAYYWKIGERNGTADDNYSFGANLSMSLPDFIGKTTTYNIGFRAENVASYEHLNKISFSALHRFKSGPHITHDFTPFSLSRILTNLGEDYYTEVASTDINTLIVQLARDEYIPAVGYTFTYDNTSDSEHKVKTKLIASLKESGNLIAGVQAIFGRDFNEKGKEFVLGAYDQFVKGTFEIRNLFPLSKRTSLATRFLAGATPAFGNSDSAPVSEYYYSGGTSGIRAFAPRSIGPGGYCSDIYTANIFHGGEIRGEANIEYRFPLFWMLEGAVFVDAGNVWKFKDECEGMTEEDVEMMEALQFPLLAPVAFKFDRLLETTALGTGFGVRFVFQNIVLRLDTGIAIHCPYDTGITSYYNIPSFWEDGIRLNFGIGYPF